jgi:hypothetical protein
VRPAEEIAAELTGLGYLVHVAESVDGGVDAARAAAVEFMRFAVKFVTPRGAPPSPDPNTSGGLLPINSIETLD